MPKEPCIFAPHYSFKQTSKLPHIKLTLENKDNPLNSLGQMEFPNSSQLNIKSEKKNNTVQVMKQITSKIKTYT